MDRCQDCGRFVGYYPIGFYDDRYCRSCFDARDARAAAERWSREWHDLCARRGY